jgi:hypothetical protein
METIMSGNPPWGQNNKNNTVAIKITPKKQKNEIQQRNSITFAYT